MRDSATTGTSNPHMCIFDNAGAVLMISLMATGPQGSAGAEGLTEGVAISCPVWQLGGTYEAVLMDFGSARPAVVEINNRMDALALQEEAEVGPVQGLSIRSALRVPDTI